MSSPQHQPYPPPPKESPSFGALMRGNLKVLAGVAVFLALAYFLWRGLAALFPESSWLQGPLD